jgi:putative spermidine/putrescine transport system ATP-binding protein
MPELQIKQIAKSFGAAHALHPTSLDIGKGQFVTILGPSGCGKSTLLRILMGITRPSSGEIWLSGRQVDALPPERRDIGMVFQSYALFPHMSVRGNLTFGLRMKKVAKPERERRIASALAICNLAAYADRMPRQLSGGQQQRVALARAIVLEPSLLLFDEPLSNLDAKLRESLRHDLVDLHKRIGATSIYVTHDQAEAMAMSDRIIVMNNGRVVEAGTPIELYRSPHSAFTASFLGQTNLLSVEANSSFGRLPWGAEAALSSPAHGRIMVSARPEALTVTCDETGEGEIVAVAFMGASALYTVRVGDITLKVSRPSGESLVPAGARVRLTVAGPLHVLNRADASPEAA